MLCFRAGLVVCLRLGGFSWVDEEVCNVAPVGSAVDGHEEGGRVVPNLAHLFADGVHVKLSVKWVQERLQFLAPLGATRI